MQMPISIKGKRGENLRSHLEDTAQPSPQRLAYRLPVTFEEAALACLRRPSREPE